MYLNETGQLTSNGCSISQSEIHPDRFAAGDGSSVDGSRLPAGHGLYESQRLLVATLTQTLAYFEIAYIAPGVDREGDHHRTFDVAHGGFFRIAQVLGEKVGKLLITAGELRILYLGAFIVSILGVQLIEQKGEKQEVRSHDSRLISFRLMTQTYLQQAGLRQQSEVKTTAV